MRILHINSYYNGSAFYKNIFDYQRISNNLTIYCHVQKKASVSLPDNDVIIGRPYSFFDKFFFMIKHKKIWNDLNNSIDINSFDLIHAHSLFSNGYEAYKINTINKTPYIVSVRNTDVNTFFKYLVHLRPLAISIMLNAKAVIFLSQAYKEYVIKKYIPRKYKKSIGEKSYVITNGIDDFWIANKRIHDMNKNIIKVASAGVVDRNKNQIVICRALDFLKRQGYDVSLDIFGEVKNKNIYRKIIRNSFVNFHNKLPKEKLIEEYQNNDIFVLLSKNETFGLVYAEAMTQGLPVIYTEGQGFDGQYKNGEIGYAVKCSDYRALSRAIIDVKNSYPRISKNAFDRCTKYDWHLINKEIIKLYYKCTRSY